MGDLRVVQPKKKSACKFCIHLERYLLRMLACCVIYAKPILETAFHEPVG